MRKFIVPLTIAAAFAIPGHAAADDPLPSVTANATCDKFTIHVTGLANGERLVVEQGSMPPYGFVMGSGVYWQFSVNSDGTADAVLRATTDPLFSADVLVVRGSMMVSLFHQTVDCTGAAPTTEMTQVEPVQPVPTEVDGAPVETRPRRVAERLTLFGLR